MATTRIFGIVTQGDNTAGIVVNSYSFNESCQIAEARSETGAVIDLAGYSRGTTVTVSGVIDTAKGNLVKAGSVLTLDGKEYIIESVQKEQSNTAFQTATITARTADQAIITVVNESSSSSSSSSESGD